MCVSIKRFAPALVACSPACRALEWNGNLEFASWYVASHRNRSASRATSTRLSDGPASPE